VQFKGSGWYVTDYAGKNDPTTSGASEKKDATAETKESGTKEKEKESKPKKPEAKKAKEKD
jgi:hypothetical protein